VIDSDPAVRKTLKRLFESQGYTIDLAGNGISGLEIFRKKLPSAVILDLRLPGMSGQDVCREIVRSAPELPIIVLTAHSDVLDKVVLLEIGARDYVTKPFSPRELVARMHNALRPSKPHCIPRTFTAHDLCVDFSKQEVTRDGASVFLNEK
jgi:DNA-binding response OmpR family regulator